MVVFTTSKLGRQNRALIPTPESSQQIDSKYAHRRLIYILHANLQLRPKARRKGRPLSRTDGLDNAIHTA
jgi:hypothetical protein